MFERKPPIELYKAYTDTLVINSITDHEVANTIVRMASSEDSCVFGEDDNIIKDAYPG